MMRFEPPPEPAGFDEKARKPGNAWLEQNPGKDPQNLWSAFWADLADGFRDLCGYSVMHLENGTVDHYLSCRNHPDLAYEWGNYRYAAAWINSSKRNEDERVLDPFEVGDDWFEILLPSLQLVLTDAVPEEQRERAQYTLERLHLGHGERVIRQRQGWYQRYQKGRVPIDVLEEFAPLIARAIRKQQASQAAQED